MCGHDPSLEPEDCAAAALHELAYAQLDGPERERVLRHGLDAVHELGTRLLARTPSSVTAAGLPPTPWRWVRAPARSSQADDPTPSGRSPAGTHLVAADGQQLVRAEEGYALLEWWDPARREWTVNVGRQPVAMLCAAAPMLLAERDQARALARRLWASRGGEVGEADADVAILADANERGLGLGWFVRSPGSEGVETDLSAEPRAAAWNVIAVRVAGPSSLELVFGDGLAGTVDLRRHLVGPVLEPLRDPDFFALARLDPEMGTVVWPNGADLAAEMLHRAVQEQQAQRAATEPPESTTGDGRAQGS